MIDAYTIGIRLALDDGVSAGIAAVRRDLATLDQAIALTAAGLVALRRLGEEISVVGPGVVHRVPSPRAPAQAPAKSQSLGQPSLLPSISGTGASPEPDLEPRPEVRNVAAPATPSWDPKPVLMRQTRLLRGSGLGASPAPERPSISPMVLDPPPSSTLPDRSPAPAISTPRPKSVAEFAPRLLDQPEWVAANRPSSRLPPAPISSPPGAVMPSVDSSSSRDLASLASPSEPTSHPEVRAAPRARSDAGPSPLVAISRIPTGPTPAVPRAPTRLVRASVEVSSERLTDNPSVMGPHRRQVRHQLADHEPAQSPASGDITLDGSRLGRWMGDVLARLGERPLSGSTGLDPRVTPDWPAMQGH